MEFLRNLTINQMIALVVVILLILIVAAVLFAISQQPGDQFLASTPTPPFRRP